MGGKEIFSVGQWLGPKKTCMTPLKQMYMSKKVNCDLLCALQIHLAERNCHCST